MKISERIMNEIRTHAMHFMSNVGQHQYRVCPICGWHEWLSSHTTGDFEVVLVPLGQYEKCLRCDIAFARSPEVSAWVLDVIEMLKADK